MRTGTTSNHWTQMNTLANIVREKNLKALEHYCLDRTYAQVRQDAIDQDVDLDELEELLASI